MTLFEWAAVYGIAGAIIGLTITIYRRPGSARFEWAFSNRHDWGSIEMLFFTLFWLPLFVLVALLTIKDKRIKNA